MTNMTQIKELYDETGKPGTIETNDFKYYMHLKKLKVDSTLNVKIKEVIFKNPSFTEQGSYQDKINNFLNNK